jgi:hypothetical protein
VRMPHGCDWTFQPSPTWLQALNAVRSAA